MKKHSSHLRLTILLGASVGLILVGLLFGLIWPPLNSTGQTLPPRETPTATPRAKKSEDKDKPIGAYVELQVQPAQAGLWSVVQWQDSAGGWHEVEGWRGTLEAGGSIRWWVAAKDFSTGPFRWVVYSRPGNQPVSSGSFKLPSAANETVRVEISVGP